MTKVFALNYMKFEASNWKLRVCSILFIQKFPTFLFVKIVNEPSWTLFRNVIIVGVKISFLGQSQSYFLAKKEKE